VEIEAVVEVLRSGWLVRGKVTERFERALAEELGVKRVVCTNSCTSALYLALKAVGVGPGHEVITTPLTFSATANAIAMTGAKVVFADVDPETLCLDPVCALDAVTAKTRAILPVHLYGNVADLSAGDDVDIPIVTDAAQALGAKTRWGEHISCFSFHASKNITTGEGGAVATDSEELAKMIDIWSQQGIRKDGVHDWQVDWGFKFQMNDIQAALGMPQLRRLKGIVQDRRHMVRRYDELLEGTDVEPVWHGPDSACNLYTVLLPRNRDKVLQAMQRRGHEVRVRYRPLHLEPFWKSSGLRLPVAEAMGERILSLPLHADLSNDDIHAVVKDLKEVLHAA